MSEPTKPGTPRRSPWSGGRRRQRPATSRVRSDEVSAIDKWMAEHPKARQPAPSPPREEVVEPAKPAPKAKPKPKP
jgi:hypothetical protein